MKKSAYPYQDLTTPQLTEEEWKDIPGASGHYQISNKGRARRVAHYRQTKQGVRIPMPAVILCQQTHASYNSFAKTYRYHLRFSITVGGKRRQINTARMIYHCFVEPFDLTDFGHVVLYRDDDSLNVCADNLYLSDTREKAKRMLARNGHEILTWSLTPKKHKAILKKTPRPKVSLGQYKISQYDLEGKLIRTFASVAEAASFMKIGSPSDLRAAVNGRRLTCKGFVWRKGHAPKVDVKDDVSETSYRYSLLSAAERKVTQYNYEGIRIQTYASIREASSATGVGRSTIQRALKGIYVTAGGYLWQHGEALRMDLRPLKKHARFNTSALGLYIKAKREKNIEKIADRISAESPNISANAMTDLLKKAEQNGIEKGKITVVKNLLAEFGFTDKQAAYAAEVPVDVVRRISSELDARPTS
ncbi:NUMOD1 domain-containing DNA-binding protein [Parapedobacter koreensis]|uniref:NUMOD1 domain-containing protein n=1 Tax=Parapedobacter koreensis TaxID=332977 RepID=A0A1H7T8D3_9SPHI|nr:NUMOD1 domain-containing DNA-binding protein [Parapedobacter koreensis]SEL81151.1 NUMOD1 domain-containing protein [Parapedobacter koreensis]